jgi:hypothetical protein
VEELEDFILNNCVNRLRAFISRKFDVSTLFNVSVFIGFKQILKIFQ